MDGVKGRPFRWRLLCVGRQCRFEGAAGQCRNLWHDFELLHRNVSYGREPSYLCHQWTVQVCIQGRLAIE